MVRQERCKTAAGPGLIRLNLGKTPEQEDIIVLFLLLTRSPF